jgi:hypothetical protein
VPDSHVPVMKFKFNGISIDLLYAWLSLWAIPDVSILCFLSIIIRNMFSLDTGCRGVYSGSCKLVFCIILWENIFFVLMHNWVVQIWTSAGFGHFSGINFTECGWAKCSKPEWLPCHWSNTAPCSKYPGTLVRILITCITWLLSIESSGEEMMLGQCSFMGTAYSGFWSKGSWRLFILVSNICPFHYPLCRPLYALGFNACLYRDKLKWNEAYHHKLVAAWMRILLNFLLATYLEC